MRIGKFATSAALFLGFLGSLGCHPHQTSYQLQNPTQWIGDELSPLDAIVSNRLRLSGEAVDFGRLMRDGKVDFALVTPSLTRMDLLNFDLSTLISPEFDQIEVVGRKVELPSNIALPQQVENYSIIPIRLNKPSYRTFVKSPGLYTFSALHGQFPVKRVVDEFQNGKSVFDIINHFHFLEVGQVEAQIEGSVENQNISVNQYRFDQELSVTAPPHKGTDQILALSLSEVNGKLSPVDLKKLTAEKAQALKVSPLGSPYVLSVLLPVGQEGGLPSFDQMSLTLLPGEFAAHPEFLDYAQAPEHVAQVLRLQPPILKTNFEPVAVYVNFSEIRKIQSGSVDTEERTVLWESWNEGFVSSVSTDSLDYTPNPERSYRFEVLYLARDRNVPVGGDSLSPVDQVTHISRTVLEVQ